MQTEVTTELMNQVLLQRDEIAVMVDLIIPYDVKLHHRAIAVSPFLLELHVDFELQDRAVWICVNQNKEVIAYRHLKDEHDRRIFKASFEDVDADWLRMVLLAQ